MVLGAQRPDENRVLPPVHPEPVGVSGLFERFGSQAQEAGGSKPSGRENWMGLGWVPGTALETVIPVEQL